MEMFTSDGERSYLCKGCQQANDRDARVENLVD
jgi:hypothetical protein